MGLDRIYPRLKKMAAALAGGVLSLLPAVAVLGQPGPPAAGGLNVSVRGGGGHQFKTDLSGGGDVSVTRAIVEPSIRYQATEDLAITGSFSYSRSEFDFRGSTGLAGLDPFNGVNAADVSGGVIYQIDDQWGVTGGVSLRWFWEDDASFGDGFHIGGFAGFSYRLNENLLIGSALGVVEQLEDDVDFIPILLINWRITDDLTLRTGRGLGTTRGPGLELLYRVNNHWEIGVAGRYDKLRFRLGGNAPGGAGDGVGEDNSFSAFGVLRYKPNPGVSFNFIGGLIFDGDVRIEDRNGNRLATADYDATPFVGAVAELRF